MATKTYLTLRSGQKMPIPGLGTFQTTINEEETEQILNNALEKGYRHIDTAFVYGNEVTIGKVLKKWISSGKLKREDLLVTTKLPVHGVHQDRVEMFIEKSLKNLQLEYVDLYLVHFPAGAKFDGKEGFDAIIVDEKGIVATESKTNHAAVWKKMEEQVDAGRAKNIGLSNYNISQIENILKIARIKPAVLQIEDHLHLQQRELVDFCHQNGIIVVAYSPLGNPRFNQFLTKLGKEAVKLPNILGDPVVGKLAKKYSKSPAQIALKFLVQRNIIPIPKSDTPTHVEQNIDLFDFNLEDDDMKELYNLEVGEEARSSDWKLFGGIETHPDYPFAAHAGT